MPDVHSVNISSAVLYTLLRQPEDEENEAETADLPEVAVVLTPSRMVHAVAETSTTESDAAVALAVADFQRASAIESSGRLDAETYRRIVDPGAVVLGLADNHTELELLPPVLPGGESLPEFSFNDPTNPVLRIQRGLQAAGYYDGPLTGVYDEATEAAVRRFQAENYLPVDGVFTEDDWLVLQGLIPEGAVDPGELYPLATIRSQLVAPPTPPKLQTGSKGGAVGLLQLLLRRHGQKPRVNGSFGKRTRKALVRFQRARDMEPTGVVESFTWMALMADFEPLHRRDNPDQRVIRWLLESLPAEAGIDPDEDGMRGALEKVQQLFGLETTRKADRATVIALSQAEGEAWDRVKLQALVEGGLGGADSEQSNAIRATLLAAIDTLHAREWDDTTKSIIAGYFSSATPWNERHWCALAVCHWLRQGHGASDFSEIPFGTRFAAVRQVSYWASQKGLLETDWSQPVPTGAVFVMPRGENTHAGIAAGNGSGHTGIVLADLGDSLHTIEGNTSDAVQQRFRQKSSLTGFIRWWQA